MKLAARADGPLEYEESRRTRSPPRDRTTSGGEIHRALIKLPNGMEFTEAEMGSTTTRAGGAIELDLDNLYGQFNYLHHTAKGPVR